MSDLYLRALMQALLQGASSTEDNGLLAEVCRRIILSGISFDNAGAMNLGVASFGPSVLANLGASGAVGDLVHYATTTTLGKIADVATGKVLVSKGVGVVPAYEQIANAHVDPAAAIAYTKLNLALSILDADINAAAAIAWSKISKSGSSLADLATRSAADLSSGTIPSARLGSGSADASKMLTGDQVWTAWDNSVCDGRLTLTTGTPVTTADVTAATSVLFTPYRGNRIACFDGTRWKMYTFSELSIAVPAAANQMYDVFAVDSAGSIVLEVLAWTSDTARATALALQDGVLVKSGATTRRYLGSFRTTAVAGQTEDSYAKRYVWNYYNRVRRGMRAAPETTDSWTYTTATMRQANANAANQLDFVVGVAEVLAEVFALHRATNNNATVVGVSTSIGYDSTSAAATGVLMLGAAASDTLGAFALPSASLRHYPAVGRHVYVWLEYSAATGTTTWYGDAGAANIIQTGILGSIDG